MQPNPDVVYDAAVERHRRAELEGARERLVNSAWPTPWLDVALWSAILGPIVGLGFIVYFARVILAAVTG